VRQSIRCRFQTVKHLLRRWKQPRNDAPVPNTALDRTRSKSELVLDDPMLRQQLVVLNGHTKRLHSTGASGVSVFLASKLRTWKEAFHIVEPDTVLRWDRELFRRL